MHHACGCGCSLSCGQLDSCAAGTLRAHMRVGLIHLERGGSHPHLCTLCAEGPHSTCCVAVAGKGARGRRAGGKVFLLPRGL